MNEFIARACSFFEKQEAKSDTTAELEKARNDLAASNTEVTNLRSQVAALGEQIKKLEADLAAKALEVTTLQAALDKSKATATDTIAGQGLPQDQLPPAGKGKVQTKAEELLAITDPRERTIFFRKHEAEIKSHWRK